jgi:hypothetical protein
MQSSCTTNIIGIVPDVSSELWTRQIIWIASTRHNSTTYASRPKKCCHATQFNVYTSKKYPTSHWNSSPIKLNQSYSFMLIEIVALLRTKSPFIPSLHVIRVYCANYHHSALLQLFGLTITSIGWRTLRHLIFLTWQWSQRAKMHRHLKDNRMDSTIADQTDFRLLPFYAKALFTETLFCLQIWSTHLDTIHWCHKRHPRKTCCPAWKCRSFITFAPDTWNTKYQLQHARLQVILVRVGQHCDRAAPLKLIILCKR